MKPILLVFLGGGIGSVLRYLISKSLNPYFTNFYLGTFLVNVLGCLVIGAVLGYALKSDYLNPHLTLLLVAGFCGGFTTFSSFGFEQYELLRSGAFLHFSLYIIASLATGLAAVAAGFWIVRQI
ncbi:fluoride efflux transporter CrcB [Zeaxanthinibacter enoshimensis]|uniref:Fluoride-specific ion channel FluC n=1 Tax=Zeaxanthinibacter enoshimensis TaxID=392009 RepID=A0A4R6TJ09_9FLAO|nr:fluoride efflux transporter CrcB [Zeaxanthinibacter enoshimensis]TDQ29179.1 CrcB protein [Zeaxanthinibacter enoshimensis]